MKKLMFIMALLMSVQLTNAQINAVTDTGDEVILYNDGTWKYINENSEVKNKIPVNEIPDPKTSVSMTITPIKLLYPLHIPTILPTYQK
jgi:hypothetical protein